MSRARKQPTNAQIAKAMGDIGAVLKDAGQKFQAIMLTVNQKRFLTALVDEDMDTAREFAQGFDEKERQHLRGVAATITIVLDEVEAQIS